MRVDSSRILIAVVAAALAIGACGDARDGTASSGDDSSDPWAAIESEFLQRCAQEEDSTGSDDDRVADYCRCVYLETVEFYGTPEAMVDANAGRPSGGLTTDPLLEPAFAGCADAHLN